MHEVVRRIAGERLLDVELGQVGHGAREVGPFVRDEIEKWSQVVRISGAKAE